MKYKRVPGTRTSYDQPWLVVETWPDQIVIQSEYQAPRAWESAQDLTDHERRCGRATIYGVVHKDDVEVVS